MKPRVLYTAFDLVPSPKGASTHITYFARGLVEAGYDLTLITAGDPALAERDVYFGATLLRAPAGEDPNFLKRAIDFGRYVLDHVAASAPYDIVHVRSVWSGLPLAEARSRFGYRLLYEVNGLPSIELKYHYPALRDAPVLDKIREWEVATLHLAEAIVCPSQVTAAYLASLGISPHKITVIPNGIDPRLFQPDLFIASTLIHSPNHRDKAAAQGGRGAGEQGSKGEDSPPHLCAPAPLRSSLAPTEATTPPTILYLGTLADWQGLETLIEAMPMVLAGRAARLRLVGPGRKRQRKMLQKRLAKLDLESYVSIEPAVPHDRVPALIAQANVCVAPLGYNDRNVTQGCCPIKILEYMACGRPAVASNLPVVRELVHAGTEALLFNPDDPADLARNLLAVLVDPALAARLGTKAASRARQQFTWPLAQARLLEVYQSLANRSRVDDKSQGFSPTRPPG